MTGWAAERAEDGNDDEEMEDAPVPTEERSLSEQDLEAVRREVGAILTARGSGGSESLQGLRDRLASENLVFSEAALHQARFVFLPFCISVRTYGLQPD